MNKCNGLHTHLRIWPCVWMGIPAPWRSVEPACSQGGNQTCRRADAARYRPLTPQNLIPPWLCLKTHPLIHTVTPLVWHPGWFPSGSKNSPFLEILSHLILLLVSVSASKLFVVLRHCNSVLLYKQVASPTLHKTAHKSPLNTQQLPKVAETLALWKLNVLV